MKIGEKLSLARRYHQPAMRQRELAELLGVDTSTIGRWESKHHIPDAQMPRVADLLNVREDWLLAEDDVLPIYARKVPVSEPANIRAVPGSEMTRGQQLMTESLFVDLPVWRGVAAGEDGECAFVESGQPEHRNIPVFLTMGQPDRHVLCIATGMSMSPRIEHAERAVVRLDPDVPPGHIVVARSNDNRNFIKKLTRGPSRQLELHSVNDQFAPITNLAGWSIKGGVVAILHAYEGGRPNIEWDEGRFLKA